jgi:hypothetical protein
MKKTIIQLLATLRGLLAFGPASLEFNRSAQRIDLKDALNSGIDIKDLGSKGEMKQHLTAIVEILNLALENKRLNFAEARAFAASAKQEENAFGVYKVLQTVSAKTKIIAKRHGEIIVLSFPIGDVAVPPNSVIAPEEIKLIAEHIPNSEYMGSKDFRYVLNATTGRSRLCFIVT